MILCLQGEGGVEYRQGRPLHSRCSQVLNNNAHKEFSSPKFLLVLRLKPSFCSSWTSMPNLLAMVSHPWAIFRPGAVCVNYVAWGGWLGLVDLHVSVHIYVWIYAYIYNIHMFTYLLSYFLYVVSGGLLQVGTVSRLLCPQDVQQGHQGRTDFMFSFWGCVTSAPIATLQEWSRTVGSETRAMCVHGMKLAYRAQSSR